MKKYSVSQLNHFIKNVFEDEFVLNNVCVSGDVAEYKVVSGSVYFTLKDSDCAMSCVYFGKLNLKDFEGKQVVITGRVSFYAKTGRVSFVCHNIQLEGLGEQYLKFLELKSKLAADGCFDRLAKLPSTIQSIALVTSIEGAVVHDFLKVAKTQNETIDIYIYPVRVQGENAASTIIEALQTINAQCRNSANHTQYLSDDLVIANQQSAIHIDCIVLARGGGSQIDLETFNNEELVRAVASSQIPIVSAIGHEIDDSLCDLAATQRAGTPSIAAQMIIPPKSQKTQRVLGCLSTLDDNLTQLYSNYQNTLGRQVGQLVYDTIKTTNTIEGKIKNSVRILGNQVTTQRANLLANQVKNNLHNLSTQTTTKFEQKTQKIQYLLSIVDKTNPAKLLSQGYAQVTKGNLKIIKVNQLKADDKINIYLDGGLAKAKVLETVELKKLSSNHKK